MLPINPVFYDYPSDLKKASRITKQKLARIEDSEFLTTVEKINLIALLLGYRFITDVAIGRKNEWGNIKEILNVIGLAYGTNSYTHAETKHEWLQVAANKPILDYVIDRRTQLTVLEAGVLYGYPVSACLAYDGMLEKEWFDKTLAEYWLSGVFSKEFISREREYFEKVWTRIAEASPHIAAVAQREYQAKHSN